MALETIKSTPTHALNLSAMPSENTPMFAAVKSNGAESILQLNQKVAELLNDGALPEKVKLTAGTMLIETNGSAINHSLQATLGGSKADSLELDDLKAIAAATAMLTQQESITIARIIDPKSVSKETTYRGLAMDIGETISEEMTKKVNEIVNDVDPTLDFTVEGSQLRFINFDPKMNQEFIMAVRDVAHMMPVDSVEMKRFVVEGAKLTNDYATNPKGQSYAQVLESTGLKDLIPIIRDKATELSSFMNDASMVRTTPEVKAVKEKLDFKLFTKDDQMGFAF